MVLFSPSILMLFSFYSSFIQKCRNTIFIPIKLFFFLKFHWGIFFRYLVIQFLQNDVKTAFWAINFVSPKMRLLRCNSVQISSHIPLIKFQRKWKEQKKKKQKTIHCRMVCLSLGTCVVRVTKIKSDFVFLLNESNNESILIHCVSMFLKQKKKACSDFSYSPINRWLHR